MMAREAKPLSPHIAAATDPAVSLLVDQHPETGRWQWKRTGKPWRGSHATEAEARAEAALWSPERHVFERSKVRE